ncbi:hypothetical protein O6H91_Y372700 [Diphasiastrum complanatum]|nr:hypothetical protein O6H91_Y372700 [Diphasiastrum complanatum]
MHTSSYMPVTLAVTLVCCHHACYQSYIGLGGAFSIREDAMAWWIRLC